MIHMNDFKQEDESLVRIQVESMERVVRSGWYVLGNEVREFEAEWACWLGTPHAVGVGNGMDALEIGLRAMGIGKGDEVITTPMTAFATVLSILRAGAEPVLADIDPDTAILDPRSVERCITSKTKAVMLVHLYGQAGPLEVFTSLCRDRGIALIEDCAQAHGAKVDGRSVGTWGACAGWSFYPTKNLGCIGDGGALSTGSDEIADLARKIRNYGQSVRYEHPLVGLNSRLDELQAAILRDRLRLLDGWITRRREIARAYEKGIGNSRLKALPLPADEQRHAHHLFVVTASDRLGLQAHLKANGVESLIHYPIPVHHQESCRGIRIDPNGLPVAERHAKECLSLPIHPMLSDREVEQVVGAVNAWK